MRGVFAGLAMNHDGRHLARAVIEGCTFALQDVLGRMDALGLAGGEVRVVGGGARSALWLQVKADVTGRPVRPVLAAEPTATGAAVLGLPRPARSPTPPTRWRAPSRRRALLPAGREDQRGVRRAVRAIPRAVRRHRASADVSTDGLDLRAVRRHLSAIEEAGRVRPLELGERVEGDGAVDRLPDVVAGLRPAGSPVVVLAAATAIRAGEQDLRQVITAALGRRFDLQWRVVGPADGAVHADEATVAAATAAADGAACVITAGSGTVTDIGKAAASPAGTPGLRADRGERERLRRPVLGPAAGGGQADNADSLAGCPADRCGRTGIRAGRAEPGRAGRRDGDVHRER